MLCDCVLPAVPDFRWGAATNAETDNDGYAIVTVTATGKDDSSLSRATCHGITTNGPPELLAPCMPRLSW